LPGKQLGHNFKADEGSLVPTLGLNISVATISLLFLYKYAI